jgi:hypothetical protein
MYKLIIGLCIGLLFGGGYSIAQEDSDISPFVYANPYGRGAVILPYGGQAPLSNQSLPPMPGPHWQRVNPC